MTDPSSSHPDALRTANRSCVWMAACPPCVECDPGLLATTRLLHNRVNIASPSAAVSGGRLSGPSCLVGEFAVRSGRQKGPRQASGRRKSAVHRLGGQLTADSSRKKGRGPLFLRAGVAVGAAWHVSRFGVGERARRLAGATTVYSQISVRWSVGGLACRCGPVPS